MLRRSRREKITEAREAEAARVVRRRRRLRWTVAGVLYAALLLALFWPHEQGSFFKRVSADLRRISATARRTGEPLSFAEASASVHDPVRSALASVAARDRTTPEGTAVGRLLADPKREMKLALIEGADLSRMRAPFRGLDWVKVDVPVAIPNPSGSSEQRERLVRVRLVKLGKSWLCEDIDWIERGN